MKSLNILVVDDNVESCETMRMLLAAAGHSVSKAHCGLTALEQARRLIPDLIILDIGLPHLDGWGVARKLREDETFDVTMIYALTGYGDLADVRKSREVGINRHFTKPLDMDEFWIIAKKELNLT